MTTDQILKGAEVAILFMAGLLQWFSLRLVNRMEQTLDKHGEEIATLKTGHAVLVARIDGIAHDKD